MIPFESAVEVPHDAHRVSVWFKGTSYGGSVHGGGPAWDSAYGRNYTFDVER